MKGEVVELFPDSDQAEDRAALAAFERAFGTDKGEALLRPVIAKLREHAGGMFFVDQARALFRAGFRCGYMAARARRG